MGKIILKWIEKILYLIGTTATLGMAVVISLQITCRYLFNSPLAWPEEVAVLLFLVSVYIGVGVIEKDNLHIRCEFFVNRLSKKGTTWLFVLGKVLTIFIIVGFLVGEKSLLQRVKLLRTPATQIPVLWLHIIILFGIGCWLLYLVVTSIDLFMSLSRPADNDGEVRR